MISVTILAKNSEKTIKKTLESLTSFKEVIVFDTGSSDKTKEIARNFINTRVIEIPFEGFGKTHNKTLSYTSYEWVLSIDSDEALSNELAEEILKTPLDPNCLYALIRHNYFEGKHIKGCSGWHPDWIVRLFNKNKTRFSEDLLHEKIENYHLKVKKLKHPLLHTPYHSIADFLSKMQSYSDLFAKMHQGKKKSSTAIALAHALYAFIKSYLFKRGCFLGKEGFIISLYNAHATWYKYLKLAEKNATLSTLKQSG